MNGGTGPGLTAEECRARFLASGDIAWLHRAVVVARETIAGRSSGSVGWARAALDLSAALMSLYSSLGAIEHLDEAVELLGEAAAVLPADDGDVSGVWNNLSGALLNRYLRTQDRSDLDAAVEASGRALDVAPPGAAAASKHTNRAGLLRMRYEVDHSIDDLNASVEHAKAAVGLLPEREPNHPMALSTLAASLVHRFKELRAPQDLSEAIFAARTAMTLTTPVSPAGIAATSILATALGQRFAAEGRLRDLNEAIDLTRRMMDDIPATQPEYATHVLGLATLLFRRFDRFGTRHDLDAIDELTRTVLTDAHAHWRPLVLSLRAKLHQTRAARSLAASDTDAAQGFAYQSARDAEEVLALLPPGHSQRPESLLRLGVARAQHFEITGDTQSRERAVEAYRRALDVVAGTDSPIRSALLFDLAQLLAAPLPHQPHPTASPAQAEPDSETLFRQARSCAPAGDETAAMAGLGLLAAILTKSDAAPPRPDDLRDVDEVYRETLTPSGAVPRTRARICMLAGHLYLSAQQHRKAEDAFDRALDLLPLIAWVGGDRSSREAELGHVSGLAEDAAACSLILGEPQHALQALERGRDVLWGQRLHLRHEDVLLSREHPDLATRLHELAAALDDDADMGEG
jgi:tetratricopeptide (TPR) repeat protein